MAKIVIKSKIRCIAIGSIVLLIFSFVLNSSVLLIISLVGMIIACIGKVINLGVEKEKRAQEEEKRLQQLKLQAEKEPVKLEYDPTKAKPWCVQEWNGVRFVQVSGWFAKYENAEKVYEQLCRSRQMRH